jgi:predicted  nucleic acid-binding Zn-ribbon protein
MSTLRETLDRLLDLQAADRERDKILKAIHALDSGRAVEAEAGAAYEAMQLATSTLHKSQADQKDAELELAGIEKKIKTFETKMKSGQVTNTREMMTIEKEIGQLRRQQSALDEKILTLMDSIENQQVEAANAEAVSKEKEERLRAVKGEAEQRRQLLDADLAATTARRQAALARVEDKALLARYESMRAKPAHAGIVIAETSEYMCGACHMQAAMQDVRKAKEAVELMICPNCGRIMA